MREDMVSVTSKKDREDWIVQLNNALELERHVVGVKFLYTKEEFEKADVNQLKSFLPYCVMVKSAASGASLKASKENFGCPDGAVSLGIYEPLKEGFEDREPDYFVSGKRYAEPGVYKDLETSQKTMEHIVILKKKAYGILLRPLEKFEEEPDVVILIADTYNMMRLVQGYSYEYGTFNNYRLAGNQAICSESTAYPFVNNNINISLLCSGTRQNSKWKDSELAMGMPYHMFPKVLNGLYQTINPLVRDEVKARIEKNMKDTNQEIIKIVYGTNYDSGIYRFGEKGVK
ncbi:MAG: DUF169 domain-containing protein [Dorea sp.]|nr:DUF169 domain-containing protein [Dorea sp.]